ncbi:MAG TPA: alpha/beta hydrolase [Steroidobacteraceae bacterium]|nr:alpha/beta hydrolase [Steroidobacteraceae bacterium]HRX90053.1 alpha/beta hydrolase [Steroidobacteraceae bacterium]
MTEQRRIVATDFGQVHVRLQGEGGVPLVLLHMSPRSSQMWTHLQPALQRRSIALDRLGYGFSDAPPRALTMREYAATTLQALDALDIGERFDVLGMHTGALEALELAQLAPQRVRNIGIVAIPIFSAAERDHGMQTFAQMKVVPAEDGAHLIAAWRARFQFRQPPWHLSDIQRRLVDYLLAPYPGQAYLAVFGYDAAPSLTDLQHPLVAFVPRDDVYDLSVRSRVLLPKQAVYVDLSDCDVDLFLTQVRRMAALIEQHLPPA